LAGGVSLNSLLQRISFSAAIYCFFSACPTTAISENAPLQVPAIIRVESGADVVLPISTSGDPAVRRAMVVIRGIPWNVSLTTGRLFPSGVWALKASEAQSARFVTAANTQQTAELVVSLITLDGNSLGNATARLEIEPNAARAVKADSLSRPAAPENTAALAALPVAPGQSEAAPASPDPQRVFSQADLDKVFKLMDRGDQHLLEGKIASARRFYQLAADIGWPEGALAIARTYDAEFLKRFPIVGGIQPNAALAKQWYDTAREISLRPLPPDLQSVNKK
jgi:hypothetical protein